jgi:hypothetical protein
MTGLCFGGLPGAVVVRRLFLAVSVENDALAVVLYCTFPYGTAQ